MLKQSPNAPCNSAAGSTSPAGDADVQKTSRKERVQRKITAGIVEAQALSEEAHELPNMRSTSPKHSVLVTFTEQTHHLTSTPGMLIHMEPDYSLGGEKVPDKNFKITRLAPGLELAWETKAKSKQKCMFTALQQFTWLFVSMQGKTNLPPQNVKSPVNAPSDNSLRQHNMQVILESDSEVTHEPPSRWRRVRSLPGVFLGFLTVLLGIFGVFTVWGPGLGGAGGGGADDVHSTTSS